MRIGVIGAGRIGGGLAVRFAAAGHQVMVSNSRGPDTLADLVASIQGDVRAGTVAETARFGEVIDLIDQIGFTGIDAGTLAEGRRLQPGRR